MLLAEIPLPRPCPVAEEEQEEAGSLGEQLQLKDDEIASWIHTTEQHDRFFHEHAYGRKRTGGEIRMSDTSVHPHKENNDYLTAPAVPG